MKVIALFFMLSLSISTSALPSINTINKPKVYSKTEFISEYYSQDIHLISYIKMLSKIYDVDFFLICALIYVESSWDSNSTSKSNAIGLMQIKKISNIDVDKNLDRYNTYDNIQIGIRYINLLQTRYGNNIYTILGRYNAGKHYKEATAYTEKILNIRSNLNKIYKERIEWI